MGAPIRRLTFDTAVTLIVSALIICGTSIIDELDAIELPVATSALKVPIDLFTGTSTNEVVELTGIFSSCMSFPFRSSNLTRTDICSPLSGGLDNLMRTTEEFPAPPPLTLTPTTSAEGGTTGAGGSGEEFD
jgi:hypothetical protein